MRVALGVEYDGHAFLGWQTQAEGPTVQAALTQAVGQVANHPVSLICAGRTDKGVHAHGQVVHFDTQSTRSIDNWIKGINSNTPESIRVCWAQAVPGNFHARFSATARRYQYFLYQNPIRPAILRNYCSWTHHSLDVASMVAASRYLIGEHDFQSLRDSECQAKHSVRTVTNLTLTQEGKLLCMDIQANAFLQHMVRNIMGTLMEVGKGLYPPEWILAVLAAKNRQAAGPTAPAEGLYLAEVQYPSEFALPVIEHTLAPRWMDR